MAGLVAGWLQENTVGGYHSGFPAAGIGMLLSLVISWVGAPLVREVSTEEAAAEDEAKMAAAPPAIGWLNEKAPRLLRVGGLVLAFASLVGRRAAAVLCPGRHAVHLWLGRPADGQRHA